MDVFFMVPLCIFLLLFGVQSVTNLQIVWMIPVMGLAALVAGIVGLIRCFR